MLISHDRWLIEAVAKQVVRIRGDGLDVHEGLVPADFERDPPPEARGAPPPAAEDHAERKRKQRAVERARKRIDALENEIAAAESKVEELDAALIEAALDHDRSTKLATERESASQRVEDLYAEWEALETEIASHST